MKVGASFFRRALPLLLAGVVLLALFAVHAAIVRQSLRLLGISSAGPKLLMLDDGCGNSVWLPAALAAIAGQSRSTLMSGCPGPGEVLALMPEPGDAVLFVNGEPANNVPKQGRQAGFTELRLRSGLNLLAAWPIHERLLFPLPVSDFSSAERVLFAWSMDETEKAAAQLSMSSDRQPVFVFVGGSSATKLVRPIDDGVVARKLRLSRNEHGKVSVEAEACMPREHPLMEGLAHMRGPEFVGRLFTAMVVGSPRVASDVAWQRLARVVIAASNGNAACTPLRTAFEVEQGQVLFLRSNRFLSQADDLLLLRGFGNTVKWMGRTPTRSEDDQHEWTGVKGNHEQLVIAPREAGRSMSGSTGDNASVNAPSIGASGVRTVQRRQGLLVALGDLRHLLPPVWTATAWALAAAAPAVLILWALRRGWPHPREARLQDAHSGLVALVAFMAIFALQPLLLQMTHVFIDSFRLLGLIGMPMPYVPASDLSAPIALCAALLVVPILQGASASGSSGWHRITSATAALVTLALLALGVMAYRWLLMLPAQSHNVLPHLPEELIGQISEDDPLWAQRMAFILLFVWLGAGLLFFWLSTFWLFRVAVPTGRVVRTAFVAGLLLLVLPLIQGVADLSWVVAFFDLDVGPGIAFAFLSSGAFVVLVVAILLRALREVTAAMLARGAAERLRRVLRNRWLVLAAIVIVLPMINSSWVHPQSPQAATYQLMSFFQAFGVLLAVLVPLAVAQMHEAGLPAASGAAASAPFDLPENIVGLMAAAFAGYLSLWNREPLAVALVMVAGWFMFRHVLIERARHLPPAPAQDLAKTLAAHVAESRLLRTRRATVEKLFGEGKTSATYLHSQRAELDKAQRVLDQKLGMTQDEARACLFSRGPGSTPLDNAKRAAIAGVGAGLTLQLLVQFQWASAADSAKNGWLAALSKFIVDPQYRIITSNGADSRVLTFLGEVLNAVSVWAIAGFLFGYVFHLIRGRDGFMRAALFGMVLTAPYLLSQALVSGDAAVPTDALLRVVPLLVVLLAIGALLFDGARLRRGGVSIARLPEIYGLKTSVGYLSFAGLLAGVQPLLDLLSWASGSK